MDNWNIEKLFAMLDSFSHIEPIDDPKYKKQQRILEAAAMLFQKYGYRKTSMDEVARKAGVAKGTLYLYFKTKADLLVQVVILEKKKYMQEMAPVFKETDAVKRLQKYLEFAVIIVTKMPISSKLAMGDSDLLGLMDEIDEDTRVKSDEMAKMIITSFIHEAAAPHTFTKEELAMQATVLRAIFFFTAKMTDKRLCGDMGVEAFAKTLSTMLVHGIAHREENSSNEGSSL